MEWQGLWHTFARHGDVVDTFIARKQSRGGKKFGFVRFANKIDAERVIEKLNGFTIYGFRLSVKMARYGRGSRKVVGRDRQQKDSPELCFKESTKAKYSHYWAKSDEAFRVGGDS
ncbi:hypothetical protein V6N13_080090 [Hibiscus sabdariffa]